MIYACSDLHGQYKAFQKLLDKINFSSEDEIYILGDVLDRGAEPIDLLLHVLLEPNMHLLMGNHEYMMLQAYKTGDFALWNHNGAKSTIHQFEKLNSAAQNILLKQLEMLPLIIPNLSVGERKFYLTHAGLYNKIINQTLMYKDVSLKEVHDIVWSRRLAKNDKILDIVSDDVLKSYKDYYVLFGHTITTRCNFGTSCKTRNPRIAYGKNAHLINLDCGAAAGKRIGCLQLETNKEFYIDI